MPVMADHRAAEKIARESGEPFAILRSGWYIENYTGNVGPLLESGTMRGAAGSGRVSVAARADYAEAAAVVLTTEGHERVERASRTAISPKPTTRRRSRGRELPKASRRSSRTPIPGSSAASFSWSRETFGG